MDGNMAVDGKLLEILCCPVSKVPLNRLERSRLGKLNKAISAGNVESIRGEKIQTVLQMISDLRWTQDPNPRRRQFDSQGNAVQKNTNLGDSKRCFDGDLKSRLMRSGAFDEKLDCLGFVQIIEILGTILSRQ